MKTRNIFFLLLAGATIFTSCNKEDEMMDDEMKNITLNISGLEDLGNDYVYEGWLIVNGAPVSTGTFTVDAMGVLSKTTFSVKAMYVDDATTFVLSIEPADDSDPAPAATKMMAGDFNGVSATSTPAW